MIIILFGNVIYHQVVLLVNFPFLSDLRYPFPANWSGDLRISGDNKGWSKSMWSSNKGWSKSIWSSNEAKPKRQSAQNCDQTVFGKVVLFIWLVTGT